MSSLTIETLHKENFHPISSVCSIMSRCITATKKAFANLVTWTETTTHTYQGTSTISFTKNVRDGLSVKIETQRLLILSTKTTKEEVDQVASVFGDPEVMEKFATGTTRTREQIQARIDTSWGPRWKTQNDPYSGFSVFDKKTGAFMGVMVLGHGDFPGESEIAYLFHKKFWGQGYASEAVLALVQEYAPATLLEGYTLEGPPLNKIVASSRIDNPASTRILEKTGMQLIKTEEKYGAERNLYSIDPTQFKDKIRLITPPFYTKVTHRLCSLFASCVRTMSNRFTCNA